MDPETGASTCALGSHRCTKYIGNFTRKAAIKVNLIHPLYSQTKFLLLIIAREKFFCCITSNVAKRGKEEVKV
jgi:hypothetical protein